MTKKKSVSTTKVRRVVATGVAVIAGVSVVLLNPNSYEKTTVVLEPEETLLAPLGESSNKTEKTQTTTSETPLATEVLEKLPVKGRASKTGYDRTEFYNSWPTIEGCSLRQRIIKREMGDTAVISSEDNCTVISGEYDEPYTGSHLVFYQKSDFTTGVQIDHVVALSDAWQKGAQNLSKEERYNLATDPLNLLAVDARTNQSKSDGDAATWLPSNKKFRCQYVARQVSVKYKYSLWVTNAEKETIQNILRTCPNEPAVGVSL